VEPEAENPVAFQARYFAAWDACDLEATAECLAADFRGTFGAPAPEDAEVLDRAQTLARVHAFFARIRDEGARWRRSAVTWLRRGPDEAVCAMRVECVFPQRPEWNNAELTLETYRRGDDGRFRIARVTSERLR
jgi:hypothetical protein